MMCESSQRSPYGFKKMGTHMITNVSSESGNGVANRCEHCGLVAQTVEHSTVNRIVEGSIPSQTSIASIFLHLLPSRDRDSKPVRAVKRKT